jgi:hypothetical protein
VCRSAVQSCQEDDDEAVVLSSEERQKLLETKQSQIQQIVGKQQVVEQCDTYFFFYFACELISNVKLLDKSILTFGLVEFYQKLSSSSCFLPY